MDGPINTFTVQHGKDDFSIGLHVYLMEQRLLYRLSPIDGIFDDIVMSKLSALVIYLDISTRKRGVSLIGFFISV